MSCDCKSRLNDEIHDLINNYTITDFFSDRLRLLTTKVQLVWCEDIWKNDERDEISHSQLTQLNHVCECASGCFQCTVEDIKCRQVGMIGTVGKVRPPKTNRCLVSTVSAKMHAWKNRMHLFLKIGHTLCLQILYCTCFILHVSYNVL